MIGKNVELIEYSRKVDFWNCVTHAAGAIFAVPAGIMLIIKANGVREIVSCTIYAAALFAVYTVSSVYHGLRNGEKKRKARLVDHSTVPMLIAGTATPCALITLFEVSMGHSMLVFILAWTCTLFGLFSKLFFFEKLKTVTMAVYIVSCAVMLISVVPLLGQINTDAFGQLIVGCIFYVVGAVLCGLGKIIPALHAVFHVFVLIGSLFHFYVIYNFVL